MTKLATVCIAIAASAFVVYGGACRSAYAGSSSSSSPTSQTEQESAIQDSANDLHVPWRAKSGEAKYLPTNDVEVEYRLRREPVRERKADLAQVPSSVETASRAFFWTCMILAACLFIAIVAFACFYLWRHRGTRREPDNPSARKRRYETLSEEAQERYDDLLTAVEESYGRGDLRSALVFYFSWILVEMDKRGFVYLEKGKTNMEYWRELAQQPSLRAIYRDVMKAFEKAYFGGETPQREEFEKVWGLRVEFEKIMAAKDEQERLAREQVANGPATAARALTILLLFGILAQFGCVPRRGYWNEMKYACDPGRNDEQSVNGVSAFRDYCKSYGDWKIDPRLGSQQRNLDCAIWFPQASSPFRFETHRNYWDMPSGVCGSYADDPCQSRAFQDAWKSNLRRYSLADDDRWDRFVTPGSMVSFANNYPMAVDWLESRENRTLVVFASTWDAVPQYLADCTKTIDATSDVGKKLLQECELRLKERQTTDSFNESFRSTFIARKKAAKDYLQGDFKEKLSSVWRSEVDSSYSGPGVNNKVPFSVQDFETNGFETGDDWNVDLVKQEKDPDVLLSTISDRRELPYIERYVAAAYEFAPSDEAKVYGQDAEFSGEESWTKGLPKNGILAERNRVEPRGKTKVLLALGDVPLVCERKFGSSRMLIVNSTSFISNYALREPTNQILAARLVDEIPKNSLVDFIYGPEFPLEKKAEPKKLNETYSLRRLSPYSAMAWNLFALAVIVAFSSYSIFGRPKRMAKERTNDFTGHLAAVGDEVYNTPTGLTWSRRQLEEYRRTEGVAPLDELDAPPDENTPEKTDEKPPASTQSPEPSPERQR